MAEARQVIFRWTGPARADYAEIRDYLMTEASVDVADRWSKSLFEALRRLVLFPLSGRLVPEVQAFGDLARQIIVRGYRVFYDYRPPHLRILAIRHASRSSEGQ